MTTRVLRLVSWMTLVGSGATCIAGNPPDSKVNPQSGGIEIAYPVWSGSNYDIEYVINAGSIRHVEAVSTNPLDDRVPRMAIAANGDAWVVWWRDAATDQVLVRKRSYSSGTWGVERTVGELGEAARNPFVIHDGSRAWIGYEIDAAGDTDIAVGVITDEPEPIGRSIVASTSWAGSRDLQLHSESGELWATWIDSASNVGWSEYNHTTQSWSSKATEPYSGDTVEAARSRIRTAVFGN